MSEGRLEAGLQRKDVPSSQGHSLDRLSSKAAISFSCARVSEISSSPLMRQCLRNCDERY